MHIAQLARHVLYKVMERHGDEFALSPDEFERSYKYGPDTWAGSAAYRIPEYRRLRAEHWQKIARTIYEDGNLEKYGIEYRRFEEYVKIAMEVAEKIAEEKLKTMKFDKRKRYYTFEPINGKLREIQELEQLIGKLREILPEEYKAPAEPAKPKYSGTKKAAFLSELIAIAKALEYAGFSGDAMKRAEGDLLNRLDELLENPEKNALEIAYTVKLLRLVQRRDVEGIKEFAK